MLMLTYPDSKKAVATLAALEEYSEGFNTLRAEFPECWFLAVIAEDRCRGEHFNRIRRDLERLP